jgi:ABC-type multidrug transport system ATPase subunit
MSHLVADSITCRLSHAFAWSDIYLDVRTSQVVGLVGRNGSGKTTLLRALFGLLDIGSGVVKLDGKYLAAHQRWRHMAYLPQQSFLPRDHNVRRAALRFLGRKGEGIVRSQPRLSGLLHRRVGDLSAGERRLLEFHLILGLQRDVVLLDEPFSQIEPLYVQLMSEAVRARSTQSAFILTDHNHWSVRDLCTGLLFLENGELRPIGSGEVELQRAGYLPTQSRGGPER